MPILSQAHRLQSLLCPGSGHGEPGLSLGTWGTVVDECLLREL